MIEFGILGPLVIYRDGVPVELRAPMLRRLLAVLLSQGGHRLSLDELAEALWEGNPPAGARSTLQVYVHRLRKALGDSGRLARDGLGYRMELCSAQVDARYFETTVALALTARSQGELGQAAELHARATGLWRGRPYSDIPNSGIVENEIRRLEELRLMASQERLEIDLDRGHHARLVPELTELASAHPYRERLLALLMLALYRSGRQAEALEVYRAARIRLARELGIDPTSVLRRLHEAILRADSQLLLITSDALDGRWEPTAA